MDTIFIRLALIDIMYFNFILGVSPVLFVILLAIFTIIFSNQNPIPNWIKLPNESIVNDLNQRFF
jgi:hypothetical protein